MFIKQVGGVGRLLSECIEVNDLDAYVAELNESARKEHEKNHQLAMEREERLTKEAEEEYHRIFAGDVTETNEETVHALLRYLNTPSAMRAGSTTAMARLPRLSSWTAQSW